MAQVRAWGWGWGWFRVMAQVQALGWGLSRAMAQVQVRGGWSRVTAQVQAGGAGSEVGEGAWGRERVHGQVRLVCGDGKGSTWGAREVVNCSSLPPGPT